MIDQARYNENLIMIKGDNITDKQRVILPETTIMTTVGENQIHKKVT